MLLHLGFLKERVEIHGGESLAIVDGAGLDSVVEMSIRFLGLQMDMLTVRLQKVFLLLVWWQWRVELGKGDVISVEVDIVGVEDQPEDEGGDIGEEDLEDAAIEVVEETTAVVVERVVAAAPFQREKKGKDRKRLKCTQLTINI